MPKVAVSDETLLLAGIVYDGDCWLRLLGVRPGTPGNGGGYSRLNRNGRTVYAHRLAYETWVGPIPEGLQIDHLCERRNCINPQHLRPSSGSENQSHGKTNGAKTRCPRGHLYDQANTITTARGSRLCRACYRHPRQPKATCAQGHAFDELNAYVDARGRRICRACRKRIMAAYFQRRKALRAPQA